MNIIILAVICIFALLALSFLLRAFSKVSSGKVTFTFRFWGFKMDATVLSVEKTEKHKQVTPRLKKPAEDVHNDTHRKTISPRSVKNLPKSVSER